ncbi:metallophosphoesterase [Mucilaginibacter daejeonensis]|uniref:metallophosphoesterase family protein n=1 Tax=Mucilaginibacter daejeonensis TaxID=398049 RepID=UPI001D173E12|nr:metallophosphoesterase [Mucilaginibacter daejeonensis]UEG53463.1 metallophosphoesterase [Mucilaginibacter daejeonensis]
MTTIAFLTDIHLDEVDMNSHGVDPYHNWQKALADVATRHVDHVIIGGDIGSSSAYAHFFDSLQKLGIPYHAIIGNHDRYDDVVAHYHEPLKGDHKQLYYSIDPDGTRYIFLDSSPGAISAEQLEWLRRQLETPHQIMLCVHHPVLSVDTPVDHLYPLQNRDELHAVLENSAKTITILCGHYHMPHEHTEGLLKQYITPAVSYQINEQADEIQISSERFGYRLITLDGGRSKTELIWLKA